MSIFAQLLGKAAQVSPEELQKEFGPIITEGEAIEAAFKVFRDKWVFTNKRLIMTEVQGITGSKRQYHSIPYKSITQFSLENAGSFDTDCDILIWVSGQEKPYSKNLDSAVDIQGLQRTLAFFVCK